ncbi:mucoidy inhibitor MuiA family protein [uncultured Maribacter sp.]|uniref:mucoidy inhibitor MuiA family protein n=1 Tax=uncultured Maribacter sp. TaxID=431308 RepID=UPI0026016F48|nr:mucoidy inhibitor MuiA family protein [uncultured Maribacter sp.]
MKKIIFFLCLFPLITLGNDHQIPSKIKEVTVYLSGAEITRNASFLLKEGTTQMTFTGLSTKVDETSIQISGLQATSILSMSYDINYLAKSKNKPEIEFLEKQIETIEDKIALFNNTIKGLEEEEKVIQKNRLISSETQSVDLTRIKEISTYYRERITAIKNTIYSTKLKINTLSQEKSAITKQLKELNQAPEKKQGELTIVFDAPISTNLNLEFSYIVTDAGWIPTYDIKSKVINAPLKLTYKAHVYQKTGNDWEQVKINLSTGNPNTNVAKPNLGTKYLNFTNGYKTKSSVSSIKKSKYHYNPSVKQVTGTILDEAGMPLPGVSVIIKGTSQGTQTDFDGNFILKITQGQELEFSYLGFVTQDIPIFSSVMNIQMEEDASMLEEVVVVGYGTSTKRELTGAVRSVNVERALSGRAAGVQIRGIGSISKSSYSPPLYVIDGMISENFVEGDLDTNEIQSIEVLKGENATSIYGSRGTNGIVAITTKKSTTKEEVIQTVFQIKKSYTITSDADITAIEINTFTLDAEYEYLTIPVLNENVFLTATFKNWEKYNLLPGEASVYFNGSFAGKTTIDPYTVKKEMTLSLGIDDNITVTRKRIKAFKSKSFAGSNRILNKEYLLEVKNNKTTPISIKIMDRIPVSQNKEIKVDNAETHSADYNSKKGILSWKLKMPPNQTEKLNFSYQVKHPKYKHISL